MMRLILLVSVSLVLALTCSAQQQRFSYSLESVTRVDLADSKQLFDVIRDKLQIEVKCSYNEKSGEINLMAKQELPLEDLFRSLSKEGWFLGNRGMLPSGEKCPPEIGFHAAQERYLESHPALRATDGPWIMLQEEQFNALPEQRRTAMLNQFEVILL